MNSEDYIYVYISYIHVCICVSMCVYDGDQSTTLMNEFSISPRWVREIQAIRLIDKYCLYPQRLSLTLFFLFLCLVLQAFLFLLFEF